MRKVFSNKDSSGFSLVEVMMAVLVLGIGILAVSKLQTSLLRSGADANNRAVASTIAQQKIDDLRRYIHLTTSGTWSAAIVSPASIAFNQIASNEGGLIGPGAVTVGNQNYSLSWTVSNYHFDGVGAAASVTSPASATLKLAHVKVTWDGVGDTTNNVVSFDTAVYGYNPKLTVLPGNSVTEGAGEINLTSTADEEFEYGDGTSFGHEEIAPDVSKKASSTLTRTVSTTFNTSDRVILARDEFRTVACPCKSGPHNTSQIYAVTDWDNVNKKRITVLETRNDTITKTTPNPVGGDASTIARECDLCCRDGLGDGGDPTASDKICRLKLVGGKLFMADPWKAIAFNIIPESYFTEGQTVNGSTTGPTTTDANKDLYVNYIGTLIRSVLLNYTTTTAFNALTTVDSTFPTYTTSSNFVNGSIEHTRFNSGADRQLQARVIYLDFPASGSYEGTTYTATNIPLDRIPFYEFNVTPLAGWVPDVNVGASGATTGDTSFDADYTDDHDELDNSCNPDNVSGRSFVSNDELTNDCEDDYSRGFFDANSGDGTVNVKAGYFSGNNGLVDRSTNTESIAITSIDLTAP